MGRQPSRRASRRKTRSGSRRGGPLPAVEGRDWHSYVNDDGENRFACILPSCEYPGGDYTRKHSLNEYHMEKFHNMKAGKSIRLGGGAGRAARLLRTEPPVDCPSSISAEPVETRVDDGILFHPRSLICSLSLTPCKIHGGRLQQNRTQVPRPLSHVVEAGHGVATTDGSGDQDRLAQQARKGKQVVEDVGLPSSSRAPRCDGGHGLHIGNVPSTPVHVAHDIRAPTSVEFRLDGFGSRGCRAILGQPCQKDQGTSGFGLFGRIGLMSPDSPTSLQLEHSTHDGASCLDQSPTAQHEVPHSPPSAFISPVRYSHYSDSYIITALKSIEEVICCSEERSPAQEFLVDREKGLTPTRGDCSRRPIRITDSPVARRLDSGTLNVRWEGDTPCTFWVKALKPLTPAQQAEFNGDSDTHGNEIPVNEEWPSPPTLSQLEKDIGQESQDPKPTPLLSDVTVNGSNVAVDGAHHSTTLQNQAPSLAHPEPSPALHNTSHFGSLSQLSLPIGISQASIPEHLSQLSFMSLESLKSSDIIGGDDQHVSPPKLVDYASDTGSDVDEF